MQFDILGLTKIGKRIKAIEQDLTRAVDEAVEVRALKMVNDTRADAPVKTGKLRNSIDIIPQDTKPMVRVYGTNVEYARRQEYEHKTKKGFFRNNVQKHKPLLLNDIKKAIKRVTG